MGDEETELSSCQKTMKIHHLQTIAQCLRCTPVFESLI
jgi:hypothetical protein